MKVYYGTIISCSLERILVPIYRDVKVLTICLTNNICLSSVMINIYIYEGFKGRTGDVTSPVFPWDSVSSTASSGGLSRFFPRNI